jgi:hypothetical protein
MSPLFQRGGRSGGRLAPIRENYAVLQRESEKIFAGKGAVVGWKILLKRGSPS